MCIVFVAINAEATTNEYKLIVGSNRDEHYERLAKPAHFWEEQRAPHILGGMDKKPGQEGGTWFAVNALRGRIGVLLNMTKPRICLNKRPRGSIIQDFLESPTPVAFFEELQEHMIWYSHFNLLTIDKINSIPEVTYFTSMDDCGPVLLSPVGVYGFGNSLMSTPFRKVEDGRNRFEQVVNKFPLLDQREDLIDGILDILKSRQSHYPDQHLHEQAEDFLPEFHEELSSRFVHIQQEGFGTRTHTIVTVTGDNLLSYEEWTMEEPIDPINPRWIHSSFSLQLPTTNAEEFA